MLDFAGIRGQLGAASQALWNVGSKNSNVTICEYCQNKGFFHNKIKHHADMGQYRGVMGVHGFLRVLSLAAVVSLATPAHSELPEPTDRVILIVSGQIQEANNEGRAEFDRAMLEQLGVEKLSTRTPWTDGERQFVGVPFARLLDSVGATGSSVRAVAANDYSVDIPFASLRNADAFLAMSMDGKRLRLRNKGPLWIVFPWSQRPELDHAEMHGYAVWQLQSLHVH